MGSKAKGNRVCIIADKSMSMKAPFLPKGGKKKDGRAIDFLKMELHKTLKSLKPERNAGVLHHLLRRRAWRPMPGGRTGAGAGRRTRLLPGLT